ncbi:MAG: hypothetical protein U5L09_03370 [Bacteroidales bacterium]|nr:hypothetical protein [Bacteroidales bacterium]
MEEAVKNWKLSPNQKIDKIVESGNIRESFAIEADVSGYVTKKHIKKGDYVRWRGVI